MGDSVAKAGARLLPLALRAPLLAMLHAVHFTTLLILAADTTRRDGHLGAVGTRRKLHQLMG